MSADRGLRFAALPTRDLFAVDSLQQALAMFTLCLFRTQQEKVDRCVYSRPLKGDLQTLWQGIGGVHIGLTIEQFVVPAG